jgi:ribosome-associated protein
MAKTEIRRSAPRIPPDLARAIAAAEDKKAADVLLLDLRKAAGFADYFLICSGSNTRQIRAIADAIIEALAADDARPAHVEGYERSEWILLDYFDFIVHIFAPDTRVFYSLERLWGNAERVEISATAR